MILLLTGCSIRSKSYYILKGDKQILQVHPFKGAIGIEKMTLPRYFNQSNLALKAGDNKVVFLSKAHWVSDMDEDLTGVLISYLKRYFNTTDIYLYPWDIRKNLTKKVALKIEEFIYHDGAVVLDASWEITNLKGEGKAQFFHISVPSKKESDSVVKSMDKAFGKLEDAIAKSLE